VFTPEQQANYKRTRPQPVPHGTHNGYVNWSCRCEQCRTAHRIKVAEWRNNR
jgi:hypothetical protein